MTRPQSALALLATLAPLHAEVRLPRLFTDRMVLQQEQPIAVWGWDQPGQVVRVSFNGAVAESTARRDGTWRVDLPAMKADGRSHTLEIRGETTVALGEVVLGEVWLVGGQSNMNRGIDVTKFDDRDLRMFWVDFSTTPRNDDLNEGVAGWTPSTAAALAKAAPISEGRDQGKPRTQFSEVGYVFAQELRKQLEVPIGVIKATVGGSTAAAWTPRPDEFPGNHPWGVEVEKVRYIAHKPGLLYHSMIAGLVPFPMRGAIWYQGEDDGRNRNYAADLTALIESYRTLWNNERFAFHMCQIAQTTYASGMLGVYEAQVEVSEKLAQCGLAPSNTLQDRSRRLDEGNPSRRIPGTGWPIVAGSNPHPPNKDIIARRLAAIALKQTYGKIDREVLGPTFSSAVAGKGRLAVTFAHAGSGLVSDDGDPLNWFEVSDGTRADDRPNAPLVYHKASATIVSRDTVAVASEQVPEPRFVRFAWHPLARHNLANKEGLPALPFRSDDLPAMWNRR